MLPKPKSNAFCVLALESYKVGIIIILFHGGGSAGTEFKQLMPKDTDKEHVETWV